MNTIPPRKERKYHQMIVDAHLAEEYGRAATADHLFQTAEKMREKWRKEEEEEERRKKEE